MKLLLSLGLRNLLRQKRRSVFLGVAIAFGMMILVMTSSFSHGITDNILNRMVVYMTGHMSVTIMENSSQNRPIIRDKDRIIRIIRNNVNDIKEIDESIGRFARLIGNARGDNTIVVGVEVNREFEEYLNQSLISGSLKDFTSGTLENPVIIYSDKAKVLGVKPRDTINMRTNTITGQSQAARLTVAAVLRSSNMFEGMAVYLPLKTLKAMIGLKPHETGELHVIFNKTNNERAAKREADRLYAKLKPGIAAIGGEASRGKTAAAVTVLGFAGDADARALMNRHLTITAGAVPEEASDDGALLGRKLAAGLGLRPGDPFTVSYDNRFGGGRTENTYNVSGVLVSDVLPEEGIILLNEKTFYKTYLENLPKSAGGYRPDRKSPVYSLFSPEWKLLPRTKTNDELETKLAEMTRTRWRGPWLDVRTMYESADFIITFEFALFVVSLVAVMILFFIILIGVLNTLRMTIRERTREIGTVRAIGMQKSDVKYLFIIETVLLTAIACLAGIVMAFMMMGVLSLFHIQSDSILSILLVDRHLYFLPSAAAISFYFFLILVMAAATSYFPARRASELPAVEALRHFE
ncbi:MAG TPA: FtsX-like permease family protein [Spirochaetota bacterium]|nr:FtsX-like permease family protein [Spirochaetota bacterium]HOD14925.1 FtsX-like permease family protein [Spirochaetota bacterium]HPN12308.1 FtsX-like permease family protein [Spirochaetota bacterium]